MNKLPKGYYAIQSDLENASKNSFTYRGVTYDVEQGVNLFATVNDACKNAKEIPQTVIDGLPYDSFCAPVLLFSVGLHKVDSFSWDRSLIMLGENAGVDPNVFSADRSVPPSLNPLREEQKESLLKGSYWYGKMTVSGDASVLVMDGFSSRGLAFRDFRSGGSLDVHISIRNIVHLGPCGKNLYDISCPDAKSGLHRELLFSNIRAVDFDDYGYGTSFAQVCARKAVFERIYYDTTEQNFGFSDMPCGKVNCEKNSDISEFTLKNCYFHNLGGTGGVTLAARGVSDRTFSCTVKGCTFIDACRENESPLNVCLTNDASALTVDDCIFTETRGNHRNDKKPFMTVSGEGNNIKITNCEITGLSDRAERIAALPTEAPDFLENRTTDWTTTAEDPHVVNGTENSDFSRLDALYEGRKPYYGDQHVHTNSGGTSDGALEIGKWVGEMDEKKVDFAIIVDHRQMRGFFLPEWNEERFVMGSEPSTKITEGLVAAHPTQRNIHYNMLVPHKYGLAMIFANFPEFNFRGDELTGSFGYPNFTKERFLELVKYIQSIGGMMVHPHPKTMLSSKDPMDYYIGEHTYLETIYGCPESAATFKDYELWTALLARGKHIYASGGSDTHGHVSNAALSTFYTKERSGKAFFDQMHTGDYTVGEVGIKMAADDNPMGSEIAYRNGMKLNIRIGDFFGPAWKENTVYEVRVVTDRGIAYSSRFNGKMPQKLQLELQKRAFYRVEIFDISHGVWVAHGNPIWIND